MTYEQAMEYIQSMEQYGSRLGLERITALLAALGNPQERLRFVHIAGTNGKGSTAAMTASVLRRAGLRTGLYISPYILDFRERMQIDGEMIPPGQLAETVEQVKAALEGLPEMGLTEFEFVTAMAFVWFLRRGCDVVVLEVGLGGRCDATNVIGPPLAAAITAIDLDHTHILGDTIEAIAADKCGIIKDGVPVVSYPDQHPEALAVIMEHCAAHGSVLYMGNLTQAQVRRSSLEGSELLYGGLELHLPLIGGHQIANCLTAVELCKVLRMKGLNISDEDMVRGIADVRFPARMEILGRSPLVLLDGAHNRAGVQALAAALRTAAGERPIAAIGGMLADKDWQGALSCIAPHLTELYTVTPSNPRALAAGELAAEAARYCEAAPCASLEEAWSRARQAAGPDGAILIWGSLYLASEMRALVLDALSP